jgi:capsular exopolysaccharide synthesis family protein
MESVEDEDRSSLREYLQVLGRRRWSIILVTVVFLGLAIAYSVVTTPVYQGTANLLLTPQLSSTLLQANGAATPLILVDVPTATQVIESKSVAQYVEKTIPNAPAVSVKQVGTTNVVQVSTQSTNAKLAAQAANAYARAYIHLQQVQTVDTINGAVQLLQARYNTLGDQIAGLQAQLATAKDATALSNQINGLEQQQATLGTEISNDQSTASQSSGGGQVVSTASVPTSPVKPKSAEYSILAVVLGLVLGVALAMALEFFDDGIRSQEDVERVAGQTPVLGLIPEIVDWRDTHAQYLVSRSSPNSMPAEAYRSLRTSIQFLGLDHAIRTVQFTSPSAAEGKTTTLANLAVVMAQAGHRVVVVCCDLRRPRLHEFFNMSNEIGFTSVLLGDATLSEALQAVPGLDGLQILASGRIPPNPSELLSSGRAAEIFSTLADHADIVLIDSPPILPVTDAAVLAGRVDAVVLVAAAGMSTRSHVTRALAILGRVNAPVAGIVLNRAEAGSYAYYRYAYGSSAQPARAERNGKVDDPSHLPSDLPLA